MSLLVDASIAALSVGANALLFSFLLGRKVQRFEQIGKDVAEHARKLERHEGKIVQLTICGAETATALAARFGNPHPNPLFHSIAKKYQRIHGGVEESGNGAA